MYAIAISVYAGIFLSSATRRHTPFERIRTASIPIAATAAAFLAFGDAYPIPIEDRAIIYPVPWIALIVSWFVGNRVAKHRNAAAPVIEAEPVIEGQEVP